MKKNSGHNFINMNKYKRPKTSTQSSQIITERMYNQYEKENISVNKAGSILGDPH